MEQLQKLQRFIEPPTEFNFEPTSHTYTYGRCKLTSVTTYVDKFTPRFDADYWAHYKAQQRGVTAGQIQHEWQQKATLGLTVGSIVHEWIEDFYNGKKPAMPTTAGIDNVTLVANIEELLHTRIVKWLQLYNKKLHKLTPIAQELRIWSLRYKLAGTIDALFEYKNKLVIGDWKINEKFTTDADKAYSTLLWPFELESDNMLNSYSLQVSLYRLLLADHGIDTGPAFICWIPAGEQPAELYEAKDYRKLLQHYLEDSISLS